MNCCTIVTVSHFASVYNAQQLTLVEFCSFHGLSKCLQNMFQMNPLTGVNFRITQNNITQGYLHYINWQLFANNRNASKRCNSTWLSKSMKFETTLTLSCNMARCLTVSTTMSPTPAEKISRGTPCLWSSSNNQSEPSLLITTNHNNNSHLWKLIANRVQKTHTKQGKYYDNNILRKKDIRPN